MKKCQSRDDGFWLNRWVVAVNMEDKANKSRKFKFKFQCGVMGGKAEVRKDTTPAKDSKSKQNHRNPPKQKSNAKNIQPVWQEVNEILIDSSFN